MKKEGVTLEIPPTSTHFNITACIKRKITKAEDPLVHDPQVATANQAAVPSAPPLQPAMHAQIPQPPIWPTAFNGLPPPWMYGHHAYPYPPVPNYPGFPYGQPPGMFPVLPAKDLSPASSPGTAFHLGIPLADFCARYKISKSDEEKLESLEYKPGNKAILTLTADDWKEVKFTVLGWKAFLEAHKRFLRDVKDGLWTRTTA